MEVSVILPSYNPTERLLKTLSELVAAGFDDIILIDDGSRSDCRKYFDEAEKLPAVTVLHHEANKGKGRALKTGFAYFYEHRADSLGAVTTDDDGQHDPSDVKKCARLMAERNCAVFGARDFADPAVPPKSRFGNTVTRFVFRAFCGIKIKDTQTGLRAFPRELIPLLMNASGERFEYETNVLLEMHDQGFKFIETPIQTIYFTQNSETHFHPFKDSAKIYLVIIKFMLSSGLSSVIDLTAFTLINMLMPETLAARVFIATVGARVLSSLFNFFGNRRHVFHSREKTGKTFARYYALCAVQMLASYGLVYLLSQLIAPELRIVQSLIKIVVDTALFFISFRIQKHWVFAVRNK